MVDAEKTAQQAADEGLAAFRVVEETKVYSAADPSAPVLVVLPAGSLVTVQEDAGELPAKRAAAEGALEHGLHEGAQRQAVAGGDSMPTRWLDRIDDGPPLAAQQHLPREQRAVERARAEHVTRAATIVHLANSQQSRRRRFRAPAQ